MTTEDDDWWFYSTLSILSSALVLIYIFSQAISTIVRIQNPLWKKTKNFAVEVHKKPTQLSYTLKLKDDQNQTASNNNEVIFHLKTSRPAEIKLLWGVSVSYVFELMRSSWSDFRIAIKEERVRGHGDTTCHSIIDCPLEQLRLSSDGTFDDVLSVKSPSNLNWEDLKNKYRYPLAIVIYYPDAKGDNTTGSVQAGGNEIHGLFVLLHVKSDTFPMPTAILSTYIKMDNGNTFLLKPLYLVEDDGEGETSQPLNPSEESLLSRMENRVDSFPNVVCCVCQTFPVSRAILPCGHVSLCAQCFQKVDKCPICRGAMQYYFRTREEDYVRPENDDINNLPRRRRSWYDVFEEWNERLNVWLGFHE